MRAIAREGFGGRDRLTLAGLPIPEPGPDDVLVRVGAAELHLFDTGHFALEENLPEIAPLIATFLDRTWRPPAANQLRR